MLNDYRGKLKVLGIETHPVGYDDKGKPSSYTAHYKGLSIGIYDPQNKPQLSIGMDIEWNNSDLEKWIEAYSILSQRDLPFASPKNVIPVLSEQLKERQNLLRTIKNIQESHIRAALANQ